jgi:outer membrane protein assembly factor BamB
MLKPMILGGLVLMAAPALAEPPTIKPIWSVQVGPEAGSQALLAAGEVVLTVTWDGRLVALDAQTGATRWQHKPQQKDALEKVQIAVDGEVVVAAWPGQAALVGYDVASGKVRWTQGLPGAGTSMVGCEGHHAAVVTHRGGGTLQASAFEPATGRPLWRVGIDGMLVGAGEGHVFAATASDVGRLKSALQAVACSDGSSTTLPAPARTYLSFMAAGAGRLVTREFEMGFNNEQLCTTTLADGARTCQDPAQGGAKELLSSAAVVGDQLLWSTSHMYAHNLDPTPDSALNARSFSTGATWRTPQLIANMAPIHAGAQLLSGFGSTGAKDWAFAIEPTSGEILGRVALAKAPRQLAADAQRGFVASTDGKIVAFALPKPGPTPVARLQVTPQLTTAVEPPQVKPLGWRVLTTLNAHPKRAKSSGSKGAGTADRVGWADAEGNLLIVGGNDDRVRVFDLRTGKRTWRSKSLRKDVEFVTACDDGTIAARVYGGKTTFFAPKGKKWRKTRRINHNHGWMSGITADCKYYIADTFNNELVWWSVAKGKNKASLGVSSRGMDLRGMRVRAGFIVVPRDGTLELIDTGDMREGPSAVHTVTTPSQAHGGSLGQAWMVNPSTLLREYCGGKKCVTELVSVPSGVVQQTVTFDTRGAGWSSTVPSALDITADGRTLFFFRLGLTPVLVDVASGNRQSLKAITGQTPYEYTAARFSRDGKRLAVGMHPASYQVTVLERP